MAIVSVASKSMERFSGLDMWRSSVSAASDARRALPGEATQLAVVAVRARVVADGLAIWAAWKGCKRWGCAAALCNRGVVRLTLVAEPVRGCNR